MPGSSRTRRQSLFELELGQPEQPAISHEEQARTAERSWDRIARARMIPRERIVPNPENPRRHYQELEPLAESIAARGVLLPLLVRDDPERPGFYITVAGSRRLLAAGLVAASDDLEARMRVAQLPCLITESDDRDAFADALLENMGRENLTRAEMMVALVRLRDDFGWGAREIARRTGRNYSDIAALLRLADDGELAPLVMDDHLKPTTASEIQRLPEPVRREVLAEVRAGATPKTEEVRELGRQLRRADVSPPGCVTSHTPTGIASAAASEDTASRDATRPAPARPLAAALVTTNNLARQIESFLDRHEAAPFSHEDVVPLARARDRLNSFLGRLGH